MTSKKSPPEQPMKLKYVDKLDPITAARYREKLKLIDEVDPYQIKKSDWRSDPEGLPDVTYPDIVNYLVHTQSAYTLQDLKAYKALESYNQFVCGWVKDVGHFSSFTTKNVALSAKVRHSQRMNETPLQPWIITNPDGTILGAHCTCMAGLGESCTHVGALLFWVEAAVKIRNSKTVTQSPAYWLLPAGIQKVAYDEVRDIDFTSATTKKRKLDDSIMSPQPTRTPPASGKKSVVPEPSRTELDVFLKKLYDTNSKPVLLSLMPGYAQHYKPTSLDVNLPKVLSELYDEKCVGMTSKDIENHCDIIFDEIDITPSQAAAVEERTRLQASSKDWFRFRTGRVTASRLHAACHTNLEKPSQSLVKAVCYPNNNKFRSKATDWGCDHERTAIEEYLSRTRNDHEHLKSSQCGLFLSSKYPFIGATPDLLVSCACCGDGCVEVKCPYCSRPDDFTNPRKEFCLENFGDGLRLKRTHPYYSQVQAQIFVCEKDFCDFVVWTPNNVHIERVQPDEVFWNDARGKAEKFFKTAVLPELVCKRFSRPSPTLLQTADRPTPTLLQTADRPTPTLLQTPDRPTPTLLQTPDRPTPTLLQTPDRPTPTLLQTPDRPTILQTADHSNTATATSDSNQELICICRKVYDDTEDRVVGCDNQNCPFVWLHFKCVNLKRAPRQSAAWYCPDCRKLPEFTKKK